MSTRLKGILTLLAAFIAGGAVGIVLTLSFPDFFPRERPHGRPGPEAAVRHLTRVLDLSESQQSDLRTIVLRHHAEMQEEIERAKKFGLAFMSRIFEEMKPSLNEKQRESALEMLEKWQKRAFPPPPPPDSL